jgi:hypothetical protein
MSECKRVTEKNPACLGIKGQQEELSNLKKKSRNESLKGYQIRNPVVSRKQGQR